MVSPKLYGKMKADVGTAPLRGQLVATDGFKIKTISPAASCSVSDIASIYQKRLLSLGPLLQDRLNATSIDKLASGSAEAIGLVRGGHLEDLTGRIRLAPAPSIEDVVVGVKGTVSNGALNVREMIYPGLQKKETKMPRALLGIIRGKWEKDEAERRGAVAVENAPARIDIGGATLLLCPALPSGKMHGLLAQRHLDPSSKDPVLEEIFLLKELPDVIYVPGVGRLNEEYGGVRAFSSGPKEMPLLNLATGSVEWIKNADASA